MISGFRDKTVYITGGSSGIGLATAKQLAALGANILALARNKERLDAAVAGIKKHCRSETQWITSMQVDVGSNEEVRSTMAAAVEEFGPPYLLINCAGKAYPHYFEEIGFDHFDETMKTNLYGIWNTTSALVPAMKNRGGHIVNVSSMAGFVGIFGYTAYCASKFGVIGFSEALRSELRSHGIGVSVLCPPDTDTPGFAAENITKPEETKETSKGAKLMSPDEVARQLIAGLSRGKFMIIPGVEGKMTWRIKRFFPGIVDAVLNSQVRNVQMRAKAVAGGGRP